MVLQTVGRHLAGRPSKAEWTTDTDTLHACGTPWHLSAFVVMYKHNQPAQQKTLRKERGARPKAIQKQSVQKPAEDTRHPRVDLQLDQVYGTCGIASQNEVSHRARQDYSDARTFGEQPFNVFNEFREKATHFFPVFSLALLKFRHHAGAFWHRSCIVLHSIA